MADYSDHYSENWEDSPVKPEYDFDWTEHIVKEPTDAHTDTLAIGMRTGWCPQCCPFLEITLKYPRTATFIKLDQLGQARFLNRIWEAVMLKYNHIIAYHERHFEHFKSGQIHLHGYVEIIHTLHFFVSGLISDFAKAFMKFIPAERKLQNIRFWNDKDYNTEFKRYTTPYLCIQFSDTRKRLAEWKQYICKENYNPI